MMLGVSGLMGSSGDGDAAAESGGGSGGSSEVGASSSIPGGGGAVEELSERSTGGGGNRWPRQETLALLKIRSDMDVTFRDASLKGPLWEEVSRKMAELGFQRSAKKCKEKFENVFKYHKRTKDGRSSKPDGKTYRFFDQLEALENTPPNPTFIPPPPPPAATPTAAPASTTNIPPQYPSTTVTSTSPTPLSVVVPPNATNNIPTSFQPPHPLMQPPPPQVNAAIINNPLPPSQIHHHFQQATHRHQPHMSMSLPSNSTSSSTSSDEDIQRRRRGRKRKWKDYFDRLMREVVHKQEQLHKNFLDTLEKRERDRIVREEAWRVQEMARMNHEHELLAQERSIASAKDAAVIAFLQKVTDQQIPIGINSNSPPPPPVKAPIGTPQPPQTTPPPSAPPPAKVARMVDVVSETDNSGGGDGLTAASSSRWPKAEVEALIDLRTSLDLKYQDSGPKGPLWEEISAAMGKLGYSRSSKRCKEKWENINKYFKKVKESNKRRPEDSKTCPYFHQLEAIYKEREKYQHQHHNAPTSFSQEYGKPENPMVPIMAQPEQQWPPVTEQRHDNGSENVDEDVDEGGGYEIIANKQQQQAASLTNTVQE